MPDVKSDRKNILAIDDNPTTLVQIQGILESSYEVSLAKNFEIAQTILNTVKVDMILLDMDLPGMSGMDILEILRKHNSFYCIPVIIVSSYGIKDVIVEAMQKGASGFVVKPVSARILLEKMRSVFKTAPRKITKESLARKMNLLEIACARGKQSQVDEIVSELGQVYFDMATDQKIAEICQHASALEYDLVVRKIKQFSIG
jgi:DNA-binding response OmpR family regulator